jgi:hypothetical protein
VKRPSVAAPMRRMRLHEELLSLLTAIAFLRTLNGPKFRDRRDVIVIPAG